MAAKTKNASQENVCPECGLPPETSGNGPDATTVYTCETGHQWTRNENKD